jgi:biotin carboxyl carrier protein
VTSFELELLGQTRVISIESSGGDRYRVVIDGVPRVVHAVRAGEFGLSMMVEDSHEPTDNRETPAAAAVRDVHVAPGGRGDLLVSLGGRTVVITVNGRRRGRGTSDTAGHGAGAQRIVAPMPGRVVRLLVAAGDVVAARQPVVVVEAMKMENELRAPKAGTVKDLTVAAGMSVEAGRVLMVIE